MKNRIFYLNRFELKSLSKLGINVDQLYFNRDAIKRQSTLKIINEIKFQKRNIEINTLDSLQDFIDCKILKNKTLVNGLYPYPNHVLACKLMRILEDKIKKEAMLERLDILILQLTIVNKSN